MIRRAPLMLAAALLAGSAPAKTVPDRHSAPAYAMRSDTAGPDGSYDYVSVDPATGRVFVGRSFGVMTFDPASGAMRTLLRRDDVAAVLPIEGTRLMLSTNAGQDSATLFDRDTGAAKAEIATGKDPDGAYFDRASGFAFVMNGESRDVTMIDIATARNVATIALGGKPEAAVGDGRGRLYVNIEDGDTIGVIDIARRRLVARYALPGCMEPTALAYDAVSQRLVSACHNRVAKLIDATTGADRGTIPIGAGADGALFDPQRRRGFISCIDGTLTVFRLDARGTPDVLQTVRTREGARTVAYDPLRDRLYLPAANVVRDRKGDYVSATKHFGIVTIAPTRTVRSR